MDRKDIIKNLEDARNSRLIAYVTGDRQPFATKVAEDVIPIFNRHLEQFGYCDKISLFIYTRGGDMITPIRVVKLLRNHCKEFEVLVPYRAHSAGTLITLGADKLVIGKLGELTPVDPTTGHPFNPEDPLNPKRKTEISVEDLNSYFLLAKEMAKVKEDQMVEVFKVLLEEIHPLSVGNAYRTFRMAKILSENLLKMHIADGEKRKKIVKSVTEDICIHGYPINRDEAKELGLNVEKPKEDLEKHMWDLYSSFAQEMKLGIPFHPMELLGDAIQNEFDCPGAIIESHDLCDKFIHKGIVRKKEQDGKPVIDMQMITQRWIAV